MHFLITGTAGFIGFHLARRLLREGHTVVGLDGMTPYYDVRLKEARHALLSELPGFRPVIAMLEDRPAWQDQVREPRPDVIIHLAAQAGVRYSIENPRAYIDANVTGSFNVLELAKELAPRHLLLASTSSIYGSNEKVPFCETDRATEPLSLYAASKVAMEAMAHSNSHLWDVPTTCFRFFTVYGPWGRPDMALFKFGGNILDGKPIDIYGHGRMERDFTFVDDLVEAIVRLIDCAPVAGEPLEKGNVTDTLSPIAPYRVVNIGGGQPVGLLPFIDIVERQTGREAVRNMMPMQPGDVPRTFADASLLQALTGYRPDTPVETGVAAFVDWYRSYYSV